MKRSKLIPVISVWAVIGAMALFLGYLQHNRKLGNPGLKMTVEAVYDEKGNVISTNTVALPESVLNFESKPMPITTMELDWLPKDTTFARRAYVAPDKFGLTLNVVMMGTDRTSIHQPEICLDGQGWKPDGGEFISIPIEKPQPYSLPVKKIIGAKDIRLQNGQVVPYRAVYVYWFVAENRLTAHHGDRMWSMAKELVRTGTLERWAYVSCIGFCPPGEEEATFNRMKQFIAASVPLFQPFGEQANAALPMSVAASH